MGEWDRWIGREEHSADTLTQGLVNRLRATLDSPETGSIAQRGIHWCLCLADAPTAGLGPDGHPARGDFLPPVPLAARMWAASEMRFHAPIVAGAQIARISKIVAITEKSGSNGPLVFVDVEHATHADEMLAVSERQTIVYRNPGVAAAPVAGAGPDLAAWDWHRLVEPSATQLFRYSALTFNSHRIHYDAPYASGVEGYPALVVHGPLTATLLLDLCARFAGAPLSQFSFRALSPAFVEQPLHLVGRRNGAALALAALGADGRTVMTASASAAIASV